MANKLLSTLIYKFNAQSTCKRATFLIEKRQNTRLSVREWLTMQAHLAICPLCPLYKKLSELLQRMIKKLYQQRRQTGISMDEQKKAALEKLLKEKIDNG